MSANNFTIDIDGAAMREALEGDSLKAVIRTFVRGASRISADSIAREAKSRLQRQLSGNSTGLTLEGIEVKSDKTGWGWLVIDARDPFPNLPFWIEDGTKQGKPHSHASEARPFFYQSAQLEQDAHERRVASAIQAALSEYGLAEGQAK